MKTVLLVDDSATMLMSLKATLEICGHRVEVAQDGQQALALLQAGLRPDLVITDIHMPRMDGIQFIQQARRTLRFTPILALTTDGQQVLRDQARQFGATGWLLKPVSGSELNKVLGQIFARAA